MTKHRKGWLEENAPKAKSPKPTVLHHWRIEQSAFGQTVITGIDRDGAHRTMALFWWSEGKFGTDAGVFKQGFERSEYPDKRSTEGMGT